MLGGENVRYRAAFAGTATGSGFVNMGEVVSMTGLAISSVIAHIRQANAQDRFRNIRAYNIMRLLCESNVLMRIAPYLSIRVAV